jgi:hypothetical protein
MADVEQAVKALNMSGFYRSSETVLINKYGMARGTSPIRAIAHPQQVSRARARFVGVSRTALHVALLRADILSSDGVLKGRLAVHKWNARMGWVASI